MNEYLRRIDKRDYLTEREHREYLKKLEKDLEILEILKKAFLNDMATIGGFHSLYGEDLDKIKNWLEGEKK